MIEKKVRNWAITVIAFASVIILFLIINSFKGGYRPWPVDGRVFDPGATGEFGDFIGGVVGTLINGITFYFIYLTLKEQRIATAEQRNANSKQSEAISDQRQAIADQRQAIADQRDAYKDQKDAYHQERFEGRFFELIKWHRENTDNMIYENPLEPKLSLNGPKVLQLIFQRIEVCYNEIAPFFDPLNITPEQVHLDSSLKARREANLKRNSLDLLTWAHCDFAYLIVYMGTSRNDSGTLAKLLARNYKWEFFAPILNFITLKPLQNDQDAFRNWQQLKSHPFHKITSEHARIVKENDRSDSAEEIGTVAFHLKRLRANKGYRYYGGHQFVLSHYYRNLYQMVRSVNEQPFSYKEKYEYVKTLRAQLSTYAQLVFFFNSVSTLGDAWEMDHIGADNVNLQLITKYNFIKNMPETYIFSKVKVSDFYPDIAYEFEFSNDRRDELVKRYG